MQLSIVGTKLLSAALLELTMAAIAAGIIFGKTEDKLLKIWYNIIKPNKAAKFIQ